MARIEEPQPEDIDSELCAMAMEGCRWCDGFGVVQREKLGPRACECVWRAIYRAVRRFAAMVDALPAEPLHGVTAWSRPGEEFLADVAIAARPHETRHIEALDMAYPEACRHTGLDRGKWFTERYKLQAELGRAYYERGLYPLHVYFAQRVQPMQPCVRSDDKSTHRRLMLSRVSCLPFMSYWSRRKESDHAA